MRKTFIAALAFAASLGSAAAAAEFDFTYASPYSPTHPYGAADVAWIERIEDLSDGRIAITPYWGGALISSREGVDELAAGIADLAYIAPIYARAGYDLDREAPSFFFGYSDPYKALDVYQALWEKYPQFADELEGVTVLGFNAGTPMHMQLRERPVETLADLKGLRIRSAADYVEALAAFGAEGVTMPMTDTYPALQKGVLDGVIAPYEALKSLSFGEVVRYYSELPHSRGVYPSRAINQASFDRLPDDLKQLLLDNTGWWSEKTLEESEKAEAAGKAFGEEQGVVFNAVSQDVIDEYSAQFAASAEEKAKALDAMGLPGTDVLNDIQSAR